jgi:hypothetical protein
MLGEISNVTWNNGIDRHPRCSGFHINFDLCVSALNGSPES